MRLALVPTGDVADGGVAHLAVTATLDEGTYRIAYATRTGALLRIDGAVAGAFDREHADAFAALSGGEHRIELEVETHSLPTHGLPPVPGLRWYLMQRATHERPALHLTIDRVSPRRAPRRGDGRTALAVVGHAHLDVAWLWPYNQTRRKAARTFAIAAEMLERNPEVIFGQSQPQLYAWVKQDEPDLIARVRRAIERRAFDTSVATTWVEPDAHIPSGESLLRQFAHGMNAMRETFGVEPSVAWLPDTFGLPSTFPTIAAHAGVRRFVNAKLAWNDTSPFPYARFRWRGPDGSTLVAAVLQSYDGEARRDRIDAARRRHELLPLGWGDGGGGLTEAIVAQAEQAGGRWTRVDEWFGELEREADALPEYDGELYLEYHRGTYTTHRAIKAANAELEGLLDEAEELAAWCTAVRAPRGIVEATANDLRRVWTIVLRNQFHDVAAGTITREAFDEVRAEHEDALRLIGRTRESLVSVLPRGFVAPEGRGVAPLAEGRDFILDNGAIRARVRPDGTLVELAVPGGRNLVTQANVVAAYVDRPKRWDAWNLDRGYERRTVRIVRDGAQADDEGVTVRLRCRRSPITMRLEARSGEPFLRVELAVAWNERHVVLRCENWLALAAREARFGQPHGVLARTLYPTTDTERAKFEVPAQRYASVEADGEGLALFVRDLYGWNARGLRRGGVHLGTSLLRGPTWPDPACDRGEWRIAYAFVPYSGVTTGALEAAWRDYAYPPRVPLFTSEDDGVLVVAVKPADDADGIIVRVRECDGVAHDVRLRCGGRMQSVQPVDATERAIAGDARLDEETLRFALAPYALASFRVRF